MLKKKKVYVQLFISTLFIPGGLSFYATCASGVGRPNLTDTQKYTIILLIFMARL